MIDALNWVATHPIPAGSALACVLWLAALRAVTVKNL